MMKKLAFSLYVSFVCFSGTTIKAQGLSQTIRGKVVDKVSQESLPGAVIVLLNSDPVKGATSDIDGNFVIKDAPIGKNSIKVTFLGYKVVYLHNLTVGAGKELVLNIGLEEDINTLNAVEIKAKVDKSKALNEMSMVSTRAFSVEESQKFAAAVNDPARMASSFAGVVTTDDGNNTISIRGNSPNGLLWRMEGVEIPNPNHFSDVGSSGGGISILSAQLLGNSDFSTGAFAAEYGNALSGVFDLKLRKGNNQKKEYTFQAGVLGIDASMEGPFKEGYDGSYLINYRYSTLGLLAKMGVPLGDGITVFQDLSMNVSLPTKKLGTFGVFGFGGISSQVTTAVKDSILWKEAEFYKYDSKYYSNTGTVGFSNTKLFKNRSYLKTLLVLSGTQNGYNEDMLDHNYELNKLYEENFVQRKTTLSSTYTQKLNAKNNIRTGIIFNQLGYNFIEQNAFDTTVLVEKLRAEGSTQTAQLFFQWNHKFNERFTSNIGLHYLKLFFNNTQSLEPRASLGYAINSRNNISIGYGLHSQLQPLGTYFAKETLPDGSINEFNKDLGLNKAHHVVLSYDFSINEYSHIKPELYYQHLFNIPMGTDPNSTYSVINNVDGYEDRPLVSNGLGKNYGLELTYERFMHNNLYYLLSGSLYDSKYKAPNGNWYNTRFNTNYTLVFTLGKEWTLSEKRKKKVIGANIKSVYVGGRRYTPIDIASSVEEGSTVYFTDQTFEKKSPAYYRLDLRVSLTRNYKNLTSIVSLDLQNSTNRNNVGGQYFDSKTGEAKYWYQAPLIPVLSYKVEF